MKFYDFPDAYDLFFTDQFHRDCTKFYKDLFEKKKYKDFLDCAVGTGQMLLPLAKMGYNVTGTDINQNMVRKASLNFAKNKLIANLNMCDFRNLKDRIKQEYDCVMCTGNSIAHVKNEDVPTVIRSMDSLVRPGGMIFIDSRNWTTILQRQQRFYLINPHVKEKGRTNHVQVWDYQKDGSVFCNHLIFEEIDNKIVSKRQFYEIYYPFEIDLILNCLEEMNYKNVNICKLGDVKETEIDKIDWYVVTAEKPIEDVRASRYDDN